MKYYINGRFLTRRMTGVERYAHELILALDRILAERDVGDDLWTILVPTGTVVEGMKLRVLKLEEGGRGAGHRWEQISLPRLARGGVLLNLANSGPVAHRNSYTIIHDAIVYRRPELFSFAYRSVHKGLGRVLSRTSRLGTVSNFSRHELSRILKLPEDRIFVVSNGSDHLGQVDPDTEILARLGLKAGGFFLFVGSPAPHKNLARALAAYASLERGDHPFVIVGASQSNVFGKDSSPLPKGALATGRLTDAEIAALYQNASALVFPSLYEGFGIPPLEAMSYDCPVLAARIPPIEEVCGDAATYFDPMCVEDIARAMRQSLEAPESCRPSPALTSARLSTFRWERSAERLLAQLDERSPA